MSLGFLAVRDLRCIQNAELELDPCSNLIYGPNAAGKTSLLEAIFLLGCGRSFRTSQLAGLIRATADEFLISGRVASSESNFFLGLRGDHKQREARLNGQPISSLADLALCLPVQVLDPEIHKLIEEGPSLRRRFMDWGVFHVEPTFHEAWRRYGRALKQRNAALRERQPEKIVRAWDIDLIRYGAAIAECRERYVTSVQEFVNDQQAMLGYYVELAHYRGWRAHTSFEESLNASWATDSLRGTTTVGPHRADLVISTEEGSARGRVSRGQQKMLAAALMLAQQAHRVSVGRPPATLLIDDPAAELDVDNLGKLLAALSKIKAQLVITALNSTVLEGHLSPKLFHVKHGAMQ